MPSHIRKIQSDHYAMALEKIHRRMEVPRRDDFMSTFLENNPNFEKMSIPEIESTMAILIAGKLYGSLEAVCEPTRATRTLIPNIQSRTR